MVSLRRLRAVAFVAFTSAVGWGVVGCAVVAALSLAEGVLPTPARLMYPFIIFTSFGLVAGAAYAVLLASIPLSRSGQRFTPLRAALFGLLSGLTVFALIAVTAASGGPLVPVGALFATVGTFVGLGIFRIASPPRIAPPADPTLLT